MPLTVAVHQVEISVWTEKLPLLSGRKVAQAFVRLGWQVARQKGSHIVLREARSYRVTVRARPSRGRARHASLAGAGFGKLSLEEFVKAVE